MATKFRALAEEGVSDLRLIVTELVPNAYEHDWLPGMCGSRRRSSERGSSVKLIDRN